jgi:hypothetical protein
MENRSGQFASALVALSLHTSLPRVVLCCNVVPSYSLSAAVSYLRAAALVSVTLTLMKIDEAPLFDVLD